MALSNDGFIAVTTNLGEILIFDKIDHLVQKKANREPI